MHNEMIRSNLKNCNKHPLN